MEWSDDEEGEIRDEFDIPDIPDNLPDVPMIEADDKIELPFDSDQYPPWIFKQEYVKFQNEDIGSFPTNDLTLENVQFPSGKATVHKFLNEVKQSNINFNKWIDTEFLGNAWDKQVVGVNFQVDIKQFQINATFLLHPNSHVPNSGRAVS